MCYSWWKKKIIERRNRIKKRKIKQEEYSYSEIGNAIIAYLTYFIGFFIELTCLLCMDVFSLLNWFMKGKNIISI